MLRFSLLPAVILLSACDLIVQPEVRLGAGQGIPSVSGTAEVGLDTFTCGSDLPAGAYTITTKVVSDGCELSFDKDVEIVAATDYQNIPELKAATGLLTSVELKITKLAFVDATTNAALDADTRIKSAAFSVNGQLVGDKTTLGALPKTVSLQGVSLTPLKTQIGNRQPASVRATSVVVLPDSPAPPKKLRIEYDAQPTLVLGTSGL